MAELGVYDHANRFEEADNQAQAQEHEGSRLDEMEASAAEMVEELSSKGGLEGFFKENAVPENIKKLKVDDLVNTFQDRIFKVLEDSSTNYLQNLNNSESANLEKLVWNSRRQNVLERIKGDKKEAGYSLAVCEGYKKFLGTAQAKALEEWDAQKDIYEAYIKKHGEFQNITGKWGKWGAVAGAVAGGTASALLLGGTAAVLFPALVGATGIAAAGGAGAVTGGLTGGIAGKIAKGIGNKINQLRGKKLENLQAFSQEFEAKMKAKFQEMEDNLATVEQDATKRIEAMRKKMQRKYKATRKPDEKAKLYEEAQAALTASDVNSMNLPTWNIPNDEQAKSDFVEVLRSLDFFTQGQQALEKLATNYTKKENALTAAKAQEKVFDSSNTASFEFHELLDKPGLKDLDIPSEYQGKIPKKAELIQALIEDLQAKGIEVDTAVFTVDDEKREDMLTDTVKLVRLCHYVKDKGTELQLSTRYQLINWIEHMRGETGGDVAKWEQGDQGKVTAEKDKLTDTKNEIYTKGTKFFNSARAIDIAKAVNNFNQLLMDAEGFSQKVFEQKREFEKNSQDFPEADKKSLEEGWKKVEQVREFLLKLATDWKKQKENYERENSEKSRLEKEFEYRNNELKDIKDNPPTGTKGDAAYGAWQQKHSAAVKAQEKADEALRTQIDKWNGQATLPRTEEIPQYENILVNEVAEDSNYVISPLKTPHVPELNERIQRRLRDDFQKEIEAKFLQKMEEYDQFNHLMNLPEGTKIKVDYKMVSAIKELKFPNELNGSTVDFKIKMKKEGEGLLLEELSNPDHTLSILGPTVKGGKPFKNAVYKYPGGQTMQAIAYNMKAV